MILRLYQHLELYLNELIGDIYQQPPDNGHQVAMDHTIKKWMPTLQNIHSILDVGCAQGQSIPALKEFANRVVGVTLGEDASIAKSKGYEIYTEDMTFLSFEDEEFDLIFARHVLEHSPMPLLTLMEWHRVSRQFLHLVVPNLTAFGPSGRNHYYVLQPDQWVNLLERAGWHPIWQDATNDMEYRMMCEKKRRMEF